MVAFLRCLGVGNQPQPQPPTIRRNAIHFKPKNLPQNAQLPADSSGQAWALQTGTRTSLCISTSYCHEAESTAELDYGIGGSPWLHTPLAANSKRPF
jgi:hypothetical protein